MTIKIVLVFINDDLVEIVWHVEDLCKGGDKMVIFNRRMVISWIEGIQVFNNTEMLSTFEFNSNPHNQTEIEALSPIA